MAAKDMPPEVLVPLKSWEDAVTEAQSFEVQLATMTARAERAERDLRHMHNTLTDAQRRSTECLAIARAIKAIGDDDVMQRLSPLGAEIVRMIRTRPEGVRWPEPLVAAGVYAATYDKSPDAPPDKDRIPRIRAALMATAATSMRLWLELEAAS